MPFHSQVLSNGLPVIGETSPSARSVALGFFVRLWKLVSGYGGCMAFCNLSDREREILAVCGLDRLWPLSTRAARRHHAKSLRRTRPPPARAPPPANRSPASLHRRPTSPNRSLR